MMALDYELGKDYVYDKNESKIKSSFSQQLTQKDT